MPHEPAGAGHQQQPGFLYRLDRRLPRRAQGLSTDTGAEASDDRWKSGQQRRRRKHVRRLVRLLLSRKAMRLPDATPGKPYQYAMFPQELAVLEWTNWFVNVQWRKSNGSTTQFVQAAPFQISSSGILSGTPSASDAGYTYDTELIATGFVPPQDCFYNNGEPDPGAPTWCTNPTLPDVHVFITVAGPHTSCNPFPHTYEFWSSCVLASGAASCDPNLPLDVQPECQPGGTTNAQPATPLSVCNPTMPAYAQPGCHTGGTQTSGGGNTVPTQPSNRGCNPNLPAYAQPGCRSGGQTSVGGQPGNAGAPVTVPIAPPAMATVDSCDATNPLFAGRPSPLTGIWYVYTGGSSEETWEFFGDSMWRHTWIAGGPGATKRTSERGRFQLSGTSLTLHVTSQSGGFVSGGAIGGGTTCKNEIRQSTLQVEGNNGNGGLVLDGAQLKFRSR